MVELAIAIVPLERTAVERWAALRHALWPDATVQEHADEAAHLLARGAACCVLLAMHADDAVGFAEAALRHDYVNGCATSPLLPGAFLEGLYVRPSHRRRGIARLLCDGVARWARAQGAREFA